ncbi:MAG: sensor histidine kinase [Chloroflexi bacterium]|nr:sensor histidine kinase [Chloroflexota bacterium]
MRGYYHRCTDLAADDLELLERVVRNLNLLADLTHGDLLLYARAGDEAVVAAQAQPQPVPSLYSGSMVGETIRREGAPTVFRVLFGYHPRHAVKGTMVRGVPTVQEVFPVTNGRGQVIAALSSEIAVLEHERQRKKSPVFRHAVGRVRESVLGGRLEGGDALGRMGVHDGPMVIDARGQIVYISAIAEHLYRRLGYADSLLKTQIAELDTNEYICFKAMELGVCLEQRVQEQELIWIKRVIPLLPGDSEGFLARFGPRTNQPVGALVVIQDITEEVGKEQELKIKSAMIQEIHHRVKNNLQTIAALLRLQARRTGSHEVAEILHQSISRILSIAVVHEFLSQDEASMINIHEVSNRILSEVTHGILDPDKRISLRLEGPKNFCLPAQQATSCALIINELLQNAVEHGYRDLSEGIINVRLFEDRESMRIEIQDDGRGLPEGFQLAQGGLGLQIVQTLVREDLKGQFDLKNGRGVHAVISFPRWQALTS